MGGVAGDLGVVVASVVTILVLDMEAFHWWQRPLPRGLGRQPLLCRVALVRVRAKASRSSAMDNEAHGCCFPLEGIVVDPQSPRCCGLGTWVKTLVHLLGLDDDGAWWHHSLEGVVCGSSIHFVAAGQHLLILPCPSHVASRL